ncbi:DUF6409 family protein [Streptomyces sp. BI20]|uniref:DUF6409 family protein n=1 Tax=Streptomyces sp. BI20 TaxID=3403460 RepID=UPI003C74A4C8
MNTTTRPTAADFPAGTLITGRWWKRSVEQEVTAGISLGPWTDHEDSNLLVWFWPLGDPIPGATVQAMTPREVTATGETLDTVDADVFRVIRDGWHHAGPVDGRSLAAALAAAEFERTVAEALNLTS